MHRRMIREASLVMGFDGERTKFTGPPPVTPNSETGWSAAPVERLVGHFYESCDQCCLCLWFDWQ